MAPGIARYCDKKNIKVTSNVFKNALKLTSSTHSIDSSHFGRAIYEIQTGSSRKAKLICLHCKFTLHI